MGNKGFQRTVRVNNELFEVETEIQVNGPEHVADDLEEELEYAFSPEVVGEILEGHLSETLIEFLLEQESESHR